jgi:hypothetical protein
MNANLRQPATHECKFLMQNKHAHAMMTLDLADGECITEVGVTVDDTVFSNGDRAGVAKLMPDFLLERSKSS